MVNHWLGHLGFDRRLVESPPKLGLLVASAKGRKDKVGTFSSPLDDENVPYRAKTVELRSRAGARQNLSSEARMRGKGQARRLKFFGAYLLVQVCRLA